MTTCTSLIILNVSTPIALMKRLSSFLKITPAADMKEGDPDMAENKKIQNTIEQYKKHSNYERFTESGRKLFQGFDQEKIIRHYHLDADDSMISFRYLSFPARILRHTCEVQIDSPCPSMISSEAASPSETGYRKASPGIAMTVYEMLTYSLDGEMPIPSGEWASVSRLGGIIGAYHATSLVSNSDKSLFAGKSDALRKACLAIHGTPAPGNADVSFILPVFDNFPVWFQFWDGDEEFPVNYQFLLPQNALQFIRYETVWYLIGTIHDCLEDFINMPDVLKGHRFSPFETPNK